MTNSGSFNRTAGLNEALAVKNSKVRTDDYIANKKKLVGAFSSGETIVCWIVGDRKDRRHGVVDPPAIKDPYQEMLFKKMFRKW